MAKEAFRPVTRILAGSKELRKYLTIERKASMTSFNNEYRDHKVRPRKSLSTSNRSSNISIKNKI